MKIRVQNPFLVLACAGLLVMPAAVQAQLSHVDNGNGTATITGYSGGGAVIIPSTTKLPDEI